MNGKPLNLKKTTSSVLSVLLLIYGYDSFVVLFRFAVSSLFTVCSVQPGLASLKLVQYLHQRGYSTIV